MDDKTLVYTRVNMLQLSSSLINRPVMSLRTGELVAMTSSAIINPKNLKIEGFFCVDKVEKRQPILLTQDIRDVIPQGFVINDYEALSDEEDLVRLQEILGLDFNLVGKPVITVNKERLGKVDDYSAESQTFFIQKIYVAQPLFKSLKSSQLGIDRNQIVEINNKQIIVKDLIQPTKVPATFGAPATS